ncbi:MAG TPA: gluconate 2-dehydrogenase subunit 3 family protein [Gemmatimonadaceae bacterium]|nr:gluconate 2-dehydrogenase subunit 3 family protein [Gemmatimonadaceae bacterium]
MNRRRALKVLGAVPIVGAAALTAQQQTPPQQGGPTKQTHEGPGQPAQDTKLPQSQAKPKFFTQREARTVRVLADDIIPKDERSGSASEAGVVEFIDFNLSVPETSDDTRIQWRGGLRWLDTESRRRFNVAYAAASEAQRHQILDDIAYADRVTPALRYGATFFARARDMVASGFFSSHIGFRDLQYIGNTFNPNWNGCPPEALAKLGVTYDAWKPGSMGTTSENRG